MLFPNPATTYWSRALSIALIAFCLQSEGKGIRGKKSGRPEKIKVEGKYDGGKQADVCL
jgi:hypothetical protein